MNESMFNSIRATATLKVAVAPRSNWREFRHHKLSSYLAILISYQSLQAANFVVILKLLNSWIICGDGIPPNQIEVQLPCLQFAAQSSLSAQKQI